MERDFARLERVREAMQQAGMAALVCRLPHNVLMLTGYWPVIAESTVVFSAQGEPVLVVPKGEEPLAKQGWVKDIRTYEPVTLEKLSDARAETTPLLAEIARQVAPSGAVVGFEQGLDSMPTPYPEVIAPLPWVQQHDELIFKGCILQDATDLLRRQRMVKTEPEIEHITLAHQTATSGMQAARGLVRPGMRESEIAVAAHGAVVTHGHRLDGQEVHHRVNAFAFCMSGPNGAEAYKQFQQTHDRELRQGDLVLVHINSYLDGFWTDLTRTFIVGDPDTTQRAWYDAVHDGLLAGLDAIRDGAPASEVDGAARKVLEDRGYGKQFKHGLGHGVGFKAIYHGEPPMLHPLSCDVLHTGMTHNVETGVYGHDYGLRIADVVVVREDHAQIITDLPRDLEWAICKS